jgi:hypothetical protein
MEHDEEYEKMLEKTKEQSPKSLLIKHNGKNSS